MRLIDGSSPSPAGDVRLGTRWAAGSTTVVLGLTGLLATVVIVLAGGQIGPVVNSRALTNWWGLLNVESVDPQLRPLPGLLLMVGVLLLIGTWLLALQQIRRRAFGTRVVARLAALWASPLVLGPPLLSSDVFSFVAHGVMVRQGLDPYAVGPSALGHGASLAAVDPRWQGALSPYGPLATKTEQFAVWLSQGHPTGAVVTLRVVAVLSVVVIAACAVALSRPERRPMAVALTALNPLVLLQIVSPAHFEGLLGAFLLAALLAARRKHYYLALALASASAAVKIPAIVAVVAILVQLAREQSTLVGVRSVLARGLAAVTVSWLVLASLVPDGLGWVRALGTPGLGHTPVAPTAILGAILSPFTAILHVATPQTADTLARALGLAVATAIVLRLLATSANRPLEATVGLGLLAVSLLGPVLYPWYLLWGLLAIVPVLDDAGIRWLAGLSALGSTLSLTGLTPGVIAVLAVIVVGIAGLALARAYDSRGSAWPPVDEWAYPHRPDREPKAAEGYPGGRFVQPL